MTPLSAQGGSLPAYATTAVPVSRSQDEIRDVLRKHGAESFQFGEGNREGQRYAGVEFLHRGYRVIMLVAIKIPTPAEVDRIEIKSKKKRGWLVPALWAEQRIWRVIAWGLRARMIAVEEGVETFEQAFLPHIVNPASGRTAPGRRAVDDRLPTSPSDQRARRDHASQGREPQAPRPPRSDARRRVGGRPQRHAAERIQSSDMRRLD